MVKVKIRRNKINWICLKEKCPKNCCASFKSNKTRGSFWQIEERFIPLSPRDYKIMVKNGLEKYLILAKDNSWYIQTKKKGLCPFLKNNKCLVYKDRPLSCRAYPFFFSKYNGLYADLSCPGWDKGWTSMKKIKQMAGDLIRLYKWQIKKSRDKLLKIK